MSEKQEHRERRMSTGNTKSTKRDNSRTISSFTGKYKFLRTDYPCMVELDGLLYPSAEHAFQAAKTLDDNHRRNFQVMNGADTARYFGRRVKLRDDWEDVKVDIMERIMLDKFTRSDPFPSQAELRCKLLDTGDARIEYANKRGDMFWGTVNGEGDNVLGKILMDVREKLREEDASSSQQGTVE